MKRSEFLKTLGAVGAVGAAGVSGLGAVAGASSIVGRTGGCALVPTEIAGPFPLDLSENVFFFRQDIIEDRVGIPMRLRMRIVGSEDCQPLQNVRVNIWLCDNQGNYSGYSSEVDLTYLRGYQITDADGTVEFLSIFPGFYPGRVVHVHLQVFVSSQYAVVSQFTWNHEQVVALQTEHADLYPDGPDPMTPESDMSFNDGYALQTATLDWSPEEGGESGEYASFIELAVDASTLDGVGHLEREAGKRFLLRQNFPNPFKGSTRIPFELLVPGEVSIELWSLDGKLLEQFDLGSFAPGAYEHAISVDADCIAQLKVKVEGRVYCDFIHMMHG